jgi:hypothetical protein
MNQTNAGESGVSRRSALVKSAGRVWINSASDAVVIAWRYRRGTDRSSACADAYTADAYTHADIPARIAAMISAAIDATDVSAAMEAGAVTAIVKSAEMIATQSAAPAAASQGIG